MASELPTGAWSNLASSVKTIVTGQPSGAETTHTKTKVDGTAVKKVDKTVEAHQGDTTVHQEEATAVVHEDVKRHEHEQVDTVVDKEVHQDHYHTTIQPIKDENVLPTKHVYKDTEAELEIDHRDNAAREKAKKEAAKIQDEKKVEDTTRTKEYAPVKEGEHIHHHIHETIQPVIERETVQEKIIHTTDHIHEVEHLNDEHHSATVAPTITLADFEKGPGGQTDSGVAKALLKEDKLKSHSILAKDVSTSELKDKKKVDMDSKKRNAPVEAQDIEEAITVGKLDA